MDVTILLSSLAFFAIVNCHVTANYKASGYTRQQNKHLGPYVGSCKGGAVCTQCVSCPAHVRKKKNLQCKTVGGRDGICCTTGQNHSEPIVDIKDRSHLFVKLDLPTLGIITKKTRNEMSQIRSKEARLLFSETPSVLYPGSASYSHYRNFRRFNQLDMAAVSNIAGQALEIAIATKTLKDREGVTDLQLELGMFNENLQPTPLGHTCPTLPFCPLVPERYRSIDGSCNNRLHPTWGSALTPYSRLLPPNYSDGVWSPRVSTVDGKALPSPRAVTNVLFDDGDAYQSEYTAMLSYFGQFLTHDISHSLATTFGNGSAISCCTEDGKEALPMEHRHYACMPIKLPENDIFYKEFDQQCMNFVRSVLAPRHDCTLGYSQQLNKVTHFIDGSGIYGSSPEQTGELRSFEGGKMKVFKDFGRDLLPLSEDPNACLTMEQGTACFSAGDTRTNQMLTLVIVHTLFLREHNRIANFLAVLNPDWDDEQLFLEARNIVIAELQVIVYKEFLPAVIGELAMEEFELSLQSGYDYSNDYDEGVEPSVINEFAAAAFRFGHSTVDGSLKLYGMKRMEEMIAIPEVMFYPSQIRRKPYMDMILSTMTTEPIQEVDRSFPDALTRYMFRGGNPFGVDLASINIQRGRDHGLRSYNDYRELVGIPRYTTFMDFGPEVGPILQRLYASVDDVDLWVGGLLEPKEIGSLVGPVFRDIIAEQFSRLKRGDRYFFESDPKFNPGSFSPVQLYELRKASMARLICDNRDGVLLAKQAPNAFRKPGTPGNEFVDCESPAIPKVNLLYWKAL